MKLDFSNIATHILNSSETFKIELGDSISSFSNEKNIFFNDPGSSFEISKENDNENTILYIKKNIRIYNRTITLVYSRKFQSRLKSKKFYLMNYLTLQLILPMILFFYIFLQTHIIKRYFIQRVEN